MAEDRHVVISCDCHAVGRPDDYTPYIEPAYRDRYEDFLAHQRRAAEALAAATAENRSLFSKEGTDEFESLGAVADGGRDGQWDSPRRVKELEADGVVAEVVFPNNGVPFGGFGESAAHELRGAGNRAYNRWLADFCAEAPGRRAGLAMLAVHDVAAAAREVEEAAGRGLRGVILPTVPGSGLPPYYDECYEPLWSAIEASGLPMHIHGGSGTPDYGDYGMVSMLVYATETVYFAHRPLWFLIWGGVLERHPDLKLVFTESKADWVPTTLEYLDGIYSRRFFSHIKSIVKHKPSEYWARQCYVAASFMTHDEALLRHRIGLDRLMWGSDYPHLEGTWPKSVRSLRRTFAGVPADETRRILTDNPAALYGFDVDRLAAVAEVVGPTVDELVAG
ncbi:MAG TPA: amidohydrolase family protein [Acidimicrobiales bacterium]|nr:amidohydrolase family protein [Acidimicrobiales bacterium]